MALDDKGVDAKRADLEKAVKENASGSAILKIMNELKAGIVPTEELLRKTKIGVFVNRLKGHKDPNVQKLANEMVGQWRSAMKKNNVGAGSGSSTPRPAGAANGNASPAAVISPAAVKQEKKAYQGDPQKRNTEVDKVKWNVTGNDVRDRYVKLMYNGLAHTSTELTSDVLEKARAVEAAAYNKFQPETSEPYRQKLSSLYQNLKNKSNPGLRISVLSGKVQPEDFVVMTHEQLKSDARREEEQRLMKENMDKAMVAQEIKSVSDALKCGKCGQKKVSYTQAQTRSADEPMTTFCECLNCGNRWKFS